MKFAFRFWLALMLVTALNILILAPLVGGKTSAIIFVVLCFVYGFLEANYFMRK